MLLKCKKLSRIFQGFDVSTYASSSSFFMILSLFPMLALILTLLRYLPFHFQDLLNVMASVFPEPLMPLAEKILTDLYSVNALAVISVTALVTIWSASRGVFGILLGLNAILGTKEHRGYFRRRITAIGYTLLLIAALLVTLILQVFGQKLIALLTQWDSSWLDVISSMFRLRNVFTIAMLTLLFMLVFAVFPARKMHLKDVVAGSLFTAVGWVGFSSLFSIYVNYGSFAFYGSMAIAILSMLWLYICVYILFLGGVICLLSADNNLNLKYLKKIMDSPLK